MCNWRKLSLSKFHTHKEHWTWLGGELGCCSDVLVVTAADCLLVLLNVCNNWLTGGGGSAVAIADGTNTGLSGNWKKGRPYYHYHLCNMWKYFTFFARYACTSKVLEWKLLLRSRTKLYFENDYSYSFETILKGSDSLGIWWPEDLVICGSDDLGI